MISRERRKPWEVWCDPVGGGSGTPMPTGRRCLPDPYPPTLCDALREASDEIASMTVSEGNCSMSIRRLGAECSLQSISSADRPIYHFTIDEFAELTAGRRITLRTLGFSSRSSDPGRSPTAESLVQDTLNTVLPDSDDSGDAHPWQILVDALAAQSVQSTVHVIRQLPYDVELSDELRSLFDFPVQWASCLGSKGSPSAW